MISVQQTTKYLDPARDPSILRRGRPPALAEQFIWTAGDAAAWDPAYEASVRGQNDKTELHAFRAHFRIKQLPPDATLYVAGPRSATVFLNGREVLRFEDDAKRGRGFNVESADVARALRVGDNVIAIQAVRGHNSLHTAAPPLTNHVTYGEVLLVKIVPGAIAEEAAPILVSNAEWRSTLHAPDNWASASFDDFSWPHVEAIGVPGSRKEFLRWNIDAGLYNWPGYSGISPYLGTMQLQPVAMAEVLAPSTQVLEFHSAGPQPLFADKRKYDIVLDFGREIAGRIRLVSSANEPLDVQTSYGESAEEALNAPYLGIRTVTVPPRGEAYGPKSAFRYVRLSSGGAASLQLYRAEAQVIAYPVEYKGSFESSDPLLNRLWETGTYTAHLCMQDDIWDGVKRDRAPWMGDLDVTGRVINDVFADRDLMESTLTALIGESPLKRPVNTIAGYSAFWITGLADFYRHSGDIGYLRQQRQHLHEVLRVMDSDLDPDCLFTNPSKHKVFVDWSIGFNSDTPDARAATHFEYGLAYAEAAYLLKDLGEDASAAAYARKEEDLRTAAQAHLLNKSTRTFGSRWQTNAMAVLAGAANEEQRQAIWTSVLSRVVNPEGPNTVITPYYGYYVLSAMASLNHRADALDWIRKYWGGMNAEGATTFWEAYDPRWPKQDFHAHLEADNKTGYYVSLAHGWSSGPAAWLIEEVLGIRPTASGFRTVSIRPDLAGLKWARGTEPTPRGAIFVEIQPAQVHVELPSNTTATLSLPFSPREGHILQNGGPVNVSSAERGSRSVVTLNTAGEYTFTAVSEGMVQ